MNRDAGLGLGRTSLGQPGCVLTALLCSPALALTPRSSSNTGDAVQGSIEQMRSAQETRANSAPGWLANDATGPELGLA